MKSTLKTLNVRANLEGHIQWLFKGGYSALCSIFLGDRIIFKCGMEDKVTEKRYSNF